MSGGGLQRQEQIPHPVQTTGIRDDKLAAGPSWAMLPAVESFPFASVCGAAEEAFADAALLVGGVRHLDDGIVSLVAHAQDERDVDSLAITVHAKIHGVAGMEVAEKSAAASRGLLAVELQDNVSGAEAGGIGRAAFVDFQYGSASARGAARREPEIGGFCGVALELEARCDEEVL